MKKVTSTLTTILLCLYVSAQVGTLDDQFNNPDGYVINNVLGITGNNETGQSIATHSDGRVVVAIKSANEYIVLVRYKTNGTLDSTYGTNGVVDLRRVSTHSAVPYAVTVLSDNKMLVAGWSWGSTKDFSLLKLKENGTPDSTFGTDGWVVTDVGSGHDEAHSLAIQNDGKIVLAGYSYNGTDSNFAVVRYTSTGILDNGVGGFGGGTGMVTLDINVNDIAKSVVIQTDQKIVVGGTSDDGGANPNFTVVRYNTDGSLDATPGNFGTGGIADIDLGNNGAGSEDNGFGLALQSDGKILMTGMSKGVSFTNNDVATIRLTTAGALDPAFNSTGAIVNRTGSFTSAGIAVFNNGSSASNTDEGARSVALQSDGKIFVGGDAQGAGSLFYLLLVRYNSNGTPDNTFDGGGDGAVTYDISTTDNEFGHAIRLHGSRIYFTGSAGNPSDLILAAIENDGTALPLVLSQFYAQKQTSKVILQWQTSSEEDVKQFIIERSNDGKTYKAIGQVAATGNSTISKNYQFADQSPFTSANNYYRLLMQDVDGNYKYSKILIVKFDGQLSASMQVFPSIVNDLLQVQLPNGLNGNVTLQVIDMNGRVIKRNSLASDGNGLSTTMDVSNLVNGVYILKAQAGNTSLTSRFTKQ